MEAVRPLEDLTADYVRPFLIAMVRYVGWADELGYPLELARILDPQLINAYAATPGSKNAELKMIRRLSCKAGITPSSEMKRARSSRRSYAPPYVPGEVAALIRAARTQATAYRRLTLLSVIVLGVECGIVRESTNNVSAADLHPRGAEWFVRTPTHCARVRPEYLPVLREVVAARPEGRLRGNGSARNLASRAKVWLDPQRGVPELSTDRLRSTYICELLATSGVAQVLAWTGIESLNSLQRYFIYVAKHTEGCPRKEGDDL